MSSILDAVHPDDLAQTENLELLSRHIVDGFLTGRHRSKHKGGGAEFAEHRAYCPGDEIRLLDWRVFGKSDRYCIKQFEEETSLQAMLVVDASGSMGFGMSTPSKYITAARPASAWPGWCSGKTMPPAWQLLAAASAPSLRPAASRATW